jgi:CheY-like chemotaxis protein
LLSDLFWEHFMTSSSLSSTPPDFQALFQSTPGLYLILALDFTIKAELSWVPTNISSNRWIRPLFWLQLQRRAGIRPSPKQTRPILVVEDDTATREFIVEMLTAQGYAVATASDGAPARAQVAANKPELVILDLVLPGASGFELLGEWRASPRTADLPVFILTSKELTPEEQRFLRANAESLLSKQEPWQEALIKQLSRVVSLDPAEKV